ncbi:MAG: hypothetical protein JWL77_2015 [Chthonomonadaceae bacterium]|nr:hypothetical protein [Chthonomonadaceae bacterium]
MIPGPDQIVACPHCNGLEKYRTLMSGNSIGSRIWTDGRQIAPMLPRPPAVVECRSCAKPYWLTEAKEVGTMDSWSQKNPAVDPAWNEAPYVEEASEEGYHAALEATLRVERALEKVLRTFVWWRGNDAYREGASLEAGTASAPSVAYHHNLAALASLLNGQNINERIMKAEALRELGEFEAATKILNKVQSPQYAAVVQQIQDLCDRADARVRELGAEA